MDPQTLCTRGSLRLSHSPQVAARQWQSWAETQTLGSRGRAEIMLLHPNWKKREEGSSNSSPFLRGTSTRTKTNPNKSG